MTRISPQVIQQNRNSICEYINVTIFNDFLIHMECARYKQVSECLHYTVIQWFGRRSEFESNRVGLFCG